VLNRLIITVIFLISDLALCVSTVQFEGVGNPGFLTIEGKGGKVTGALTVKGDKSSGTFEVNLNDFDTGISLRNEHMKKKYLETDTYPIAKFILDPILLPKDGKFKWTGNLTLHGVTNKIDGDAEVLNKVIDVSFSIKMSDFKINKAIYLGVGFDDKISITLNLDIP
jgi:polyisoprenoid-binding protein YceI